ncbi:hypothetical protein SDC9_174281 [bioreactor metagenome]|uniref:Uncharacterized protein n=1 Tax=bioreactor metagenome TaxID=1076179 RepID=A0A645GJG9_9ZZZZ
MRQAARLPEQFLHTFPRDLIGIFIRHHKDPMIIRENVRHLFNGVIGHLDYFRRDAVMLLRAGAFHFNHDVISSSSIAFSGRLKAAQTAVLYETV